MMSRIVIFARRSQRARGNGLGICFLTSVPDSNVAFAEVCKEIERQIEAARTITWKTVYYTKLSNKDGTRTWIGTQTNMEAYKAPGLYREVLPTDASGIHSITIEDRVHGKRSSSCTRKEKKAILFILGEPTKEAIQANSRDRFTQILPDITSNAERLGKMEMAGHEAEGFRVMKNGAASKKAATTGSIPEPNGSLRSMSRDSIVTIPTRTQRGIILRKCRIIPSKSWAVSRGILHMTWSWTTHSSPLTRRKVTQSRRIIGLR